LYGPREPGAVPHRRPVLLLLALLVLAGGCKGGDERTAPETTQAPKPPLVYAAVGASETVGTGADQPATQAWPRVLADTLGQGGRQVTFTSLGFGGATVADALASTMPKFEALQPPPDLVTVWLNANDIITEFAVRSGASGTTYEQRLGELVKRLRRGGETTVLLANTPALDRLPAYLGCLEPAGGRCLLPPPLRPLVPKPDVVIAKVEAYNQAIARVAQREGAVLVDLHAASLKVREEGRDAALVSADGFHPSTAGHAAVAEIFAEAARKADV
jgi:lysophospholipase L1-like esterase